jgi:hypothetical protein
MIMYGSTTCILRACRHYRCIGLWWRCSAPDWGVSVDMMKGRLRSAVWGTMNKGSEEPESIII